jgi:hypothetical protein
VKQQKPCLKCFHLKMEKVGSIFHWICDHTICARDFGSPGEVVPDRWAGLPSECPVTVLEIFDRTDSEEI